MARTLIRGWKVLASMIPEHVVDHGAVIVDDDRIEMVGDAGSLAEMGLFDMELGSDDFIVMPGLVNAHYHNGSKFRAGHKDSPLELWLQAVHAGLDTEPASMAYDLAQYSACEMVKAGITCCLDNIPINQAEPDYGIEPTVRAYSDLGMRVAIAPMVSDQSTVVYGDDDEFLRSLPPMLAQAIVESPIGNRGIRPDDYLRTMRSVFRRFDESPEGTIRVVLCPHGEPWCSDAMLRKILAAARDWGAGIHMHLLESKYQMQYAFRTRAMSAIEHLCELGILGEGVSCAHAVWLTDDDIKRFADSGAIAVHNPSSNLRLGSGIARVGDMLRGGVKVAVGTDGMSIGGANDLLSDLRLADLLQRVPGLRSPRVSPRTWLHAATQAGADATFFGDMIGTLEPGKRADITLVSRRRMFTPYVNDAMPIMDVLLHFAHGSDVSAVLVNGKLIMKDRRILTIDEDALLQRLRRGFDMALSLRKKGPSVADDLIKQIEAFYSSWDNEPMVPGYVYNVR